MMRSYLEGVIAAALMSPATDAQSAMQEPAPQVFHVQGTVYDNSGKPRALAVITFTNAPSGSSVVVSANESAFYEADLPFGVYFITLKKGRFRSEAVPLFRVTSPITITFNLNERLAPKVESFRVPGSDGTPFEAWIRYGDYFWTFAGYHDYKGDPRWGDGYVHVAYNLFYVRAKHVRYYTKKRRIEADGDVLIRDENGERHAKATVFSLENGTAVQLKLE